MLVKAGKVLRLYLPVVILLGLFILPLKLKPKNIIPPSRNLTTKLTELSAQTQSKPILMHLNEFLQSQRGLLKYDESGNLAPNIANSFSTELNIYLKITPQSQLPDGRDASPSNIESYLRGFSAQGKSDERLKDFVSATITENDVVQFTFSQIHTGCLELLYELLGKNIFYPLATPRFEETIKLVTQEGAKSFKVDKISYLAMEKLSSPLKQSNYVKPDNIKAPANNTNDYILIEENIPTNMPKNITVIPSTLTKATVLGFNLTNPKFQNRAARQVIRNTLSGNASVKISGSPFSILFMKDNLPLANSVAASLKKIGYEVKLVSVDDENQMLKELHNGYHEAFIATLYKNTFDWEYRYLSSGRLPNGEYKNLNFFYFTDTDTDRYLEKLEQTFDTKGRDTLKRQILERVKEEVPCVFLKEEPICYYLIGQKDNLEKIVDKAHK